MDRPIDPGDPTVAEEPGRVSHADAPPDVEASPAPAGAPRRRWVLGALVGLLLAAVVAESVLLFRGSAAERARSEVRDLASRFLAALTTYNTETLAAQRERVLAMATGRFRSDYDQLTGQAFLSALRERQADSRGRVLRVAVTAVGEETAQALGLVEVSITNKDLPAPRVERNLIELSLVRTTRGWRVDAVSVLGVLQ
jgi:Mce-associated membrane protein